ncbi:sensor histidine kinase [Pelagicoccus mobilis]|uniref:Histidine kinase domain-containing protein n=1 Tax=Pelagicoccus mobilis TaxID=415221 RepID=A0A934VP66_9BACT|nr:ATP-binding protein [Pelagicoccus mobilis]MBK1875224.1 hypothetical protein [Pelagicoccus mobilis]
MNSTTLWGEEDAVPIWKISESLAELEREAADIQDELDHLPHLEDTLQLDAYGYHSNYLPAIDSVPEEPRWTVTIDVPHGGYLEEVYLIPAADRRSPEIPGYGFPVRFRLIGHSGEDVDTILVDWRDRDFPDPGRLPVRLLVEPNAYEQIVIEVFRGKVESGKEFFALDEVALRPSFYLTRVRRVKASGSFEAHPFWSTEYLYDQKTSMGLPVQPSEEGRRPELDFVHRFEGSYPHPVVIEMDLGENKRNGELTIYPAQPPEGVFVPGYGYPGKVTVDLFRDVGEDAPVQLIDGLAFPLGNRGNNIMRQILGGREGRWLRLTFEDFPEYQGIATFGLGEIELTEARESMSLGAKVSSPSLHESESEALQRLTDGLSGGNEVLPLLPWLDGLSDRRDLVAQLDANLASQSELKARKSHLVELSLTVALWGGGLIFLFTVVLSVLIQKRRLLALRQQIAKDLHDEVGSNLGSVRLVAERLQKDIPDASALGDLDDLVLFAREASVSLTDVIWVTARRDVHVSELIENFRKRAHRVLAGAELAFENEYDGPDSVIPLPVRRQLMMIFKEAVHNCARHSCAKKVLLAVSMEESAFVLKLEDDGVGFDFAGLSEGWGIDSMQERASELGGKLDLQSEPGVGTRICLRLPIAALTRSAKTGYKSSN